MNFGFKEFLKYLYDSRLVATGFIHNLPIMSHIWGTELHFLREGVDYSLLRGLSAGKSEDMT